MRPPYRRCTTREWLKRELGMLERSDPAACTDKLQCKAVLHMSSVAGERLLLVDIRQLLSLIVHVQHLFHQVHLYVVQHMYQDMGIPANLVGMHA